MSSPLLKRIARIFASTAKDAVADAIDKELAGGEKSRKRAVADSGPRRPGSAGQGVSRTTSLPGARSSRAGAHDGVAGYDVASLGLPDFTYSPDPDGDADPGEVVWTWVPFEEDPTQGKDRPVLVLARHGKRLVVAQLTSKDHDLDAAQEARWGRYWHDVGTGPWDSKGRPSEVRLDRLLLVEPDVVRREGATMNRSTFNGVVTALRAHWA
ncbi:type II toxin-antitoxin system PemK/MazF family toxin [Actinomyces sp. 594]|uniref:type II toxin-antitoxin system PemK/MazF family toxin n=1 Tax=Actinomyces sp. 594 TaxID=2057793 RepID=UPI001C575B24|nr:type II toxin-antitoxin system PemK/MazF family toxin [Actinomyces sp. 594]MBW3070116.1 type II toxin-antitoxin system PemK/MazF family toxin [Actinomyces sp. 594]